MKEKKEVPRKVPEGLDETKLEPAAYWVPLEVVRRWDRNPRNNANAVAEVARSIKRFGHGNLEDGFGAPLLARLANGEIIAGDTRIQAAELLGMKRVPVRFMKQVEGEAHLLALADNRLGEIAEWDDERLIEILKEAEARNESFRGTGFSDRDIDKLLEETMPKGGKSGGGVGGLTYQIVIECNDEQHQADLLGELEAKGLTCRPLML